MPPATHGTRALAQRVPEHSPPRREEIDDAILAVDERGLIGDANASAAELFGYAPAELAALPLEHLIVPPHWADHEGTIADYLGLPDRPRGRDVTGWRKDGGPFPARVALLPFSAGGRAVVLLVVHDLGRERRAEAQLRALECLHAERGRLADIGALAARVAHDVRGPLASASLHAQLLRRQALREPEVPAGTALAIAEGLLAQVARIDGLATRLLDYARGVRLALGPVDLRQLLRRVADAHATREADIVVLCPDILPLVEADEVQLGRALDQLARNAVEALAGGPGRITLSARVTMRGIVVAVTDDGPGFPPQIEPFRLFESSKPGAAGLGLAIARQVVEAHGGAIQVGRGEPRGARVTIELCRPALPAP